MEKRLDINKFIFKLQAICEHTLLNRDQKRNFIDHAVRENLALISVGDLPLLRKRGSNE